MEETSRRRALQMEFNEKHGIVPQTIRKPIREQVAEITDVKYVPKAEIPNLIIHYEAEMNLAAEMLDFERAISMRDLIRDLERKMRGELDAEKEQKESEKKGKKKKESASSKLKKDQNPE